MMSASWIASSSPMPDMAGTMRPDTIRPGAKGPKPGLSTLSVGLRNMTLSPSESATGTSSYSI